MTESVQQVVRLARAAGAKLGGTSLILIDGPAGSGKTTLAAHVAVALGGQASRGAGTYEPPTIGDDAADAATPSWLDRSPVQTLHGDDMYEGWAGLSTLDAVLIDLVLAPLSAGKTGRFRMWDWGASARTHLIEAPTRPYLIVEGVGVASPAARAFASCVVFVEAPPALRLARGLARDGEAMREEWLTWQRAETDHLARSGARDAATVIVDGSGSDGARTGAARERDRP